MSFQPNLPASARRHFEAADILFTSENRRDVAGYLYGIAAECAVKAMMLEAGRRPLERHMRNEDPFYSHFPQLKTLLRDSLVGRSATTLRRFVEDPKFMNQWDIEMRYSKGSDIRDDWVETWRTQARDIVNAIGT